MCKARRHNVKEEIYCRNTSLFISMYIQRNIKKVSLLKQENQLYHMLPKRNMCCLVCTFGKYDSYCMMVYSSSTELLVLPLSLGEQASKTWSQMSRNILMPNDFKSHLEDLHPHPHPNSDLRHLISFDLIKNLQITW